MIQRLFLSPTRYPNLKKTLQQSSLFLHFFKDLQNQNFARSGLESVFQRFALKNLSTLSHPLKSTSKSKNLTVYSKTSNSSLITYKKISITFFCYLYRHYYLFLQQATFGHLFLQLLLCLIFLFGRFKSLKCSSDWTRQLEQKKTFL